MDYYSKRIFNVVWFFIQLLGLLNIILVLVWTIQYLGGFAWQQDPVHEFNYHPLFAVLGSVVFHGNGLLIYRIMRFNQKSTLKSLHISIFVFAFIFTVVSLKTVFDSHDYRVVPIANMYSLHSWIGLGTVILFSIQFCFGLVTFLYPGIKTIYRRTYMPVHQFFGITIFVLAIASCHSGITEKVKASLGKEYQNLPPAAYVANFLGVSLTVFGILILYLVAMPQYKRRPLPEEDKLHLELCDAAT